MNKKSEFICVFCIKILHKPIELPCKCAHICQEHANEFVVKKCSNESANKRVKISIECPKCGLSFDETFFSNFNVNHLLHSRLETFDYLNGEEKLIKNKLEEQIQQMDRICTEFNNEIASFSLTQCDHFLDLKNQVDIRRETLLENFHKLKKRILKSSMEKIHAQSQALINKIELHETRFRSNFENIIKPNLIRVRIDEEKVKLTDLLRKNTYYDLTSNYMFFLFRIDLENKLNELMHVREIFALFEYDLKRNMFLVDKKVKRIYLGELILCEDFLRTPFITKINVMTVDKVREYF